jgi:tRNA 2-selenouridine synthase SelU
MSTTEINNSLMDGYMQLLSGLTEKGKKMLIQRLQSSVKTSKKNEDFFAAYGAWVGNESAEELIETIKAARTENHLPEVF